MERTPRAMLIPAACGWRTLSERDAHGNAAQGVPVFVDAPSCYVMSTGNSWP
jgi:hypothetical protein